MPSKRRVVITRPQAQATALALAAQALGREVVVLPLLQIAPLPDQSALKAEMARLDQYDMVAFVSPNAIDAAFAHISAWPSQVAIAILGEGSRTALLAHGIDPATIIHSPSDPSRSDSEHLLQSLDLAALDGAQVLIVRGEHGRELMADGLRAAGATVHTIAAYRRSTPPLTPALAAQLQDLLALDNDWIITSSEALRGLVSLAGPANVANMQHQHFIVAHARIAETAQALGLQHITLTGSGDERLLAALQLRP